VSGAEFRRFLPPQRRPGLGAVAVRWRVEITLLAVLLLTWHYLGGRLLTAVLAATVLAAAAVPAVRPTLVRAWQLLVVPHRVRAALVQAGVTDRAGRPPWILFAASAGPAVRVELRLRAGVTVDDLRDAQSLLEAACGASAVQVMRHPQRSNRAALAVHDPMWGLPCYS
jgi:hypothetical protein